MRTLWAVLLLPVLASAAGYEPDRRIRQATRLDWEFVAGGRLPSAYDSRRQRAQFFAPATYKPARAWPLVIFLPAGDEPKGWPLMEKACTAQDWFFASPYAAGAGRPVNVRARLVLDLLDDIRREYRIDPARTYLVGQGAGGVLACRVAFSLPGLFAGVVLIDADAPLPTYAHLRHRLKDRLSMTFIGKSPHGERLFRDLGIRSRRWDARPDAATLRSAIEWMEAARDDRSLENRTWRVAGKPDAGSAELAAHALEKARRWMDDPAQQWRAVAVLEWLVVRHGRSETGRAARKLYDAWRGDPARSGRLAEVIAADRRPLERALARAEERRGRLAEARKHWLEAVRLTPDLEEKAQARAAADRLGEKLARSPYLGMVFEGQTCIVRAAEAGGPAYRAGVKAGDRLERLGPAKVATLADIRAAVAKLRPGDAAKVEVLRGEARVLVTLTVGSRLKAEE